MKCRLLRVLLLLCVVLLCSAPVIAGAASLQEVDHIYAVTASALLPVNETVTWTIAFDGTADMDEYSIGAEFYYRAFDDHGRTYNYHTSGVVAEGSITAKLTKEGRYLLYLSITDTEGNSNRMLAGYYVTKSDESEALRKAVDDVKAKCLASGADNDYDKARFVHDYIINHADYDSNAVRKDDPEGVLIDGAGVCQSYSYAYQMVMKALGIECLLIEDVTGSEHVWNLIRVDGKWYHVDCTFDDPSYFGLDGNENDTHFMIPDEVCDNDHAWKSCLYPDCSTYLDGQYMRYDVYFADQESFNQQLNACIETGKIKNVIVHYAGTDTDFNITKLGILISNWHAAYGRQYGVNGWLPSVLSEDRYFRYAITFYTSPDTPSEEYDGIVDEFGYTIGEDGVTIARYLGTAENVIVPAYIAGQPVTHIGYAAFYKNSTLRTVQLPETLTMIDDGTYDNIWGGMTAAFAECEALTSIRIPGSVVRIGDYAFQDCKALRSITIEEGVREIGLAALHHNSSLTELILPSTMESIGQNALIGTSLTQLHLPASVASFHSLNQIDTLERFTVDSENQAYAAHEGVLFDKYLTGMICYPSAKKDTVFSFPEGCRSISIRSLSEVTNLTEIIFPASANHIYNSFQKPTNIRAYHVAENSSYYVAVEGILYSKDMTELVAFPSKKSMAEYTMPDTVTAMDMQALSGMTYVKKLTVSKNLKVFYFARYCESLEEVIFKQDGALEQIYGGFEGCTSLKSIALPEGITELSGVFSDCTALETVDLPSSLKEIYYTFSGCTSLKRITLPDGLETINQYTFERCSALRAIRIPASVTTIAADAFMGCYNLRIVNMEEVPEYYPSNLFSAQVTIASTNRALEAFADELGCKFVLTTGVCDHSAATADIRPATGTTNGYRGALTCYACGQMSEAKKINRDKVLALPSALTVIREAAFAETAMQQVTVSESVEEIGSRAFADSTSLLLVVIPDSVNEIAPDAFEGSDNAAILCKEDSCAYEYALDNGMMYFIQ